MLLFVLNLLLFSIAQSQITSITLIASTSLSIPMYKNSRVQPNFNNFQHKFNCAIPNTYIYQQTPQEFLSNAPYTMSIVGQGSYNITYSTSYDHFKPIIFPTACVGNCNVSITNNCPNPLDNHDYFDIVNINVGNLSTISYRIDCNNSFEPYEFQWGLFVLIIWMTILIFVSSYFSKSLAFDGFGITLNYYILIAACIFILLGGILGIFFISTVNVIVEVICWAIGIFCVGVCANEILYLMSSKTLNKPLFSLKDAKFNYIRPIEVISLFIGIFFTSAWWFTDKNWILNDLLSCCIIVTSVQFLKFTSLRMTTHYFASILLVQIVVALVLYFTYNQSYNIIILNDFNNPMQIQFPSITRAIDYKCSWLPITEIIFPAIFISYMRRFDKSRQAYVYIFISSITFFCGCFGWAILDAFTSVPVPLGLFIEPVLLLAVTLSSLKRNEIKVIWFGKFYDMDYKDIEDFKSQMRHTMQRESSKVEIEMQPRSSLFKGLRVDDQRESIDSDVHTPNIDQLINQNSL